MTKPLTTLVASLFATNAAWHGAAAYYFLLRPRGMLRKYSKVYSPAQHQLTIDVVRFLGGINVGYSVLSLVALFRWYKQWKRESKEVDGLPPIHKEYDYEVRLTHLLSKSASDLLILSLANLSQFLMDIVAHRNGRWQSTLIQITLPDCFIGLLDLAMAAVLAILWTRQKKAVKEF